MRLGVVAYTLNRIFIFDAKTFIDCMKGFKTRTLSATMALLIGLTIVACGSNDDDGTTGGAANPPTTSDNLNSNLNEANRFTHRLEFPRVRGGNSIILVHQAQMAYNDAAKKTTSEYGVNFSVEWDTSKKSQRWTCYQMYDNNSASNTSRYYPDTSKGEVQYPQDAFLTVAQRFASDPYWGSGYDHGHICPSADRLCSREANIQTFYLTNMQPQRNSFNAGVWLNGENWLRGKNTATFRDTLFVVKGGTIDNDTQIKTRLSSGLIVPRYFFVAALCKKAGQYMAIGLWFDHNQSSGNMNASYVRNINELEELTGIDFFCNLPDAVEKKVESLPRENVARVWGLK